MWRKRLVISAAIVALAALAACETVTELGEVRIEGTWDGVGALQAETGGFQLDLQVAPDGSFGGTWKTGASSGQVIQGVNEGGQVEFTLLGFGGVQSLQFTGQLTNAFRLEGSLNGYSLDGPAVFRKGPTHEQ